MEGAGPGLVIRWVTTSLGPLAHSLLCSLFTCCSLNQQFPSPFISGLTFQKSCLQEPPPPALLSIPCLTLTYHCFLKEVGVESRSLCIALAVLGLVIQL